MSGVNGHDASATTRVTRITQSATKHRELHDAVILMQMGDPLLKWDAPQGDKERRLVQAALTMAMSRRVPGRRFRTWYHEDTLFIARYV